VSRRDANLELIAGFPYTAGHASTLGRQLIELLYPRSPMKGLITDLDDTLWAGIVGEVGPSAVTWNLSEHSQVHGLYQQELRHLSEIGVLLAIASKNEPAVVEEALRREDLYIKGAAFFPVGVSWGPKSEAVRDILQTWNVGPESVVFVDDSPMEMGEVQAAFPSLTCLQFPRRSAAQALQLFEQLRDLFGKPVVQAEDTLRQSSIRANAMLREAAGETANSDFIRGLGGKLTFDSRKDGNNKRLLELINKTNQFNLNGVRITDGEWLRDLQDDSVFALGVSYEDKFGPLGVIAVMAGRQRAHLAEVTSWVLSCRAFSRKIEHHMLDYLFRRRGVKTVRLFFQPTERNVPFQRFLRSLDVDCDRLSGIDLVEGQFPLQEDLPHQVSEL
jgi:FkbH-like protein